MSELHPATRGFASADRYERGRPSYPAAALAAIVERLQLRAGRTVLDLAAGTGKLTRLLASSGAGVVAVEPVAEMRTELERRVPGIRVLDGTAERIPLADGSVDGVTVAQAFHWFRADEALREIHRVLRPNEWLALVWNVRDERDRLQAELSRLVAPLEHGVPRRHERDWRTVFDASDLFEHAEVRTFANVQEVDEQGLVERITSISFVAAADDATRAEIEARVRALVRDAELPIRLPYTTELYLGRAKVVTEP
ncbi:MAG TPA: class I SAM-dependent methyltransferase [Gaiellaceae bacterium]|nr:class I SAM-dependent methyltransferase [Gaiellaceae bacterium]